MIKEKKLVTLLDISHSGNCRCFAVVSLPFFFSAVGAGMPKSQLDVYVTVSVDGVGC